MATASAPYDVATICSVCLEPYKGRTPKLLPCFHTLCLPCLKDLEMHHKVTPNTNSKKEASEDKKPNTFPCPTCRAVITVPPGGVTHFQTNFYVNNKAISCDVCDLDQEAEYSCTDCGHNLCGKCQRLHDKFFSNHQMQSLALSSQKSCQNKVDLDSKRTVTEQLKVLEAALVTMGEEEDTLQRERQAATDVISRRADALKTLATQVEEKSQKALTVVVERLDKQIQEEMIAARLRHSKICQRLPEESTSGQQISPLKGVQIPFLSDEEIRNYQQRTTGRRLKLLVTKYSDSAIDRPAVEAYVGSAHDITHVSEETNSYLLMVTDSDDTEILTSTENPDVVKLADEIADVKLKLVELQTFVERGCTADSATEGIKKELEILNSKLCAIQEGKSRTERDMVTVQEEFGTLKRDLTRITQNMSNIQLETTNIRGSYTLQKDTASIQTDLDTLKQNVLAIKDNIATLQQEIRVINERHSEVCKEINEIQLASETTKQVNIAIQRDCDALNHELLSLKGSLCPCQKADKERCAKEQFNSHPLTAQETKLASIEAPLELINQKMTTQEIQTAQVLRFWLDWVEEAFPDLYSHAYFVPPVDYYNRKPVTREIPALRGELLSPTQTGQPKQRKMVSPANAQSSSPQPATCPDKEYTVMQRVMLLMQKMFEMKKKVLVATSQIQFQECTSERFYSAAAARCSALPLSCSQKDGSVLFIDREDGLVICEIRSLDNIYERKMPYEDINSCIRTTLQDVIHKLDEVESNLLDLVSDIAPCLVITKVIALPELKAEQVEKAISVSPQLTQDLCLCLEAAKPADITGLCLCSDQLPNPKTPLDFSSNALKKLESWWVRRMRRPDRQMTRNLYKTLVARIFGLAATVAVPCISSPRLSIKTMGKAGEYHTALITLFPEQLNLITMAPPLLFMTGPPGTGKTVVLLLMSIEWLRCGHDVYIVSTWDGCRAACYMLFHLLLQIVKTHHAENVKFGKPHLLQYDFYKLEDVEKAVNDLTQETKGASLHVIADEPTPIFSDNSFLDFCGKLLARVSHLHLWVASCFKKKAPAGFQVENLTRSLRSSPAIVREVKKSYYMDDVGPYTEPFVPDHRDGAPVRQLYHRGRYHSCAWPHDCPKCGREIAAFLRSLCVGISENTSMPSATLFSISGCKTSTFLQWRDVLVLTWCVIKENSDVVKELRNAGIPARFMKDDDIEDVATARSNVVWVADGDRLRSLERKIVVCLQGDQFVISDPVCVCERLYWMSRCTSHLAIISPNNSI